MYHTTPTAVSMSWRSRVPLVVALLLALIVVGPAAGQSTQQVDRLQRVVVEPALRPHVQGATANQAVAARPWQHKLDHEARLLAARPAASGKQGARGVVAAHFPVRLQADAFGVPSVDVFVQLHRAGDAPRLDAFGVERRTQVGDVVLVRAPLAALQALAEAPFVRYVETSKERPRTNDVGRVDIRADEVHAGTGLPQAYRGEGVVVGVLDSGLDVAHPDFSDAGGTRVQYLLEYTQDGAERMWSKAEIDADPASVTLRDGNGGGGHGTHVTGTAAGGGQVDPAYTGIAPAADIVFVKGIRDPDSNGGFADADVVNGTQFIFDRAAELGQPAVVNLSLGGNFGPLDGTSLYEQALSNMTGPGRLIVAAAGNAGFDLVHAGGTSQPNVLNQTILLANNAQFTRAEMWYEPGTVARVSVAMYGINEQNEIVLRGQSDPIDVGQVLGVDGAGNFAPVPLQADGNTLGYLYVDAATTQDQRNGDGNVLFYLTANEDASVDVSQTIWGLLFSGGGTGRVDLWAGGGSFYPRALGFQEMNEMPGDNASSVGSPATARNVIAVGSYTTKTAWTDVDGVERQLQVPDGSGEGTVVPAAGDISYFSSRGPTRDGRTAPDIAAPGERIASVLSSHLEEGQGVRRSDIVQGGSYQLMQGTSMASPHVTGVVALMLQADPTLDYERAVRILQETARTDAQTGTLPNNDFGAGRVDAWAAVQRAAEEAGTGGVAIAGLNVTDVEMAVQPGSASETVFELRNTGDATLSYTITPSRTMERQAAEGLSTFTSAAAAPPDRPRLGDGATASGSRLAARPASRPASTAAPDAAGILFLDDGDEVPDTFLGFGDGLTDLYWANQFDVAGANFQLEQIAFYMRTSTAFTNSVWLAVYDGQLQTLASGTVELDLAADGRWFSVELNTPVQFRDGETFYVEVGTSGAIDYAAGADTVATVPGKSYFLDPDAGQYVNLRTVPGYADGAFLLRAVGTIPEVQNQPPNAVARVSSLEAQVGEVLTFDASTSSDADGQVVGYQWAFGDGATNMQRVAEHAFTQAGTYAVSLTVTDNDGATGQASAQVTVTDAPIRLTVSPATGALAPGETERVTVRLDADGLGEGSYDGRIDITSNGGNFVLPVRVLVDQAVDAEAERVLPTTVQLDQNYPNPFRAATSIRYVLPEAAQVELSVFDVYGRRVTRLDEGHRPAGVHVAHWAAHDAAGRGLASGLYVYRLQVAGDGGRTTQHSGRMMLVR